MKLNLEELKAEKLMRNAPKDGSIIIGVYHDGEIEIKWSNDRRCMLASVAPGAGIFPPGWEDIENGLPIDEPLSWRSR